MVEYVTREEFEARVGVLEDEVSGEKSVTRYILEQTRRNGDDLASLKTRLDRVETRLDGVEGGIRGLTAKVDGLVRNLPAIVGNAVREVMKEGDSR
jgi:hypothetical protein